MKRRNWHTYPQIGQSYIGIEHEGHFTCVILSVHFTSLRRNDEVGGTWLTVNMCWLFTNYSFAFYHLKYTKPNGGEPCHWDWDNGNFTVIWQTMSRSCIMLGIASNLGKENESFRWPHIFILSFHSQIIQKTITNCVCFSPCVSVPPLVILFLYLMTYHLEIQSQYFFSCWIKICLS